MGHVYHGSSTHGIKRLEPKKSTHGTYVYATEHKPLAVHFSGRCGDDFTYALGHFGSSKDSPWELVELIPGALEKMYSNSSSVYTFSDETFKDIHTGFSEVVSEVGVDVVSEEKYNSVYEAMMQLEKEGLVKIYRYPDRPKIIPQDSSHLIDKLKNYSKISGRKTTKRDLDRLFVMHPELMDKINEYAEELGYSFRYRKEDLLGLFKDNIIKQLIKKEERR